MSRRVPILRTLGVDDQERRETKASLENISEIEDEESFFEDEEDEHDNYNDYLNSPDK